MITSRVGHSVFVVGGTGLLGRVVAAHLLVAGWRVRLLVRNAERAQWLLGSGFDYISGDVNDETAIERGLEGITIADALRLYCSMLRPGTRVITVPIGIMRVIDRLFVGGRLEQTLDLMALMSRVGEHGDPSETTRVPLLFRYLIFPIILRDELADKERQEALIRMSNLDWTIVRPSRLSDGPKSGRYRTGSALSYHASAHLSRADLAAYLVSLLAQSEAARQTMEVSS